jgi:hypothetical protein
MKANISSILRRLAAPYLLLVALATALAVVPSVAEEKKLAADELLQNHLASIGSPEARAKATSRLAEGRVVFSERIQHTLQLEGAAALLSRERKLRCEYKFGSPQYPGEQFVFDGQKQLIAMVDQTSRSQLGNFLFLQDEVLREGLWGGALSTAWPLLHAQEKGFSLKSIDMRKVDGSPLQEVTYVPKRRSQNGDLVIKLYFDPETSRHVLTIYTLTMLHGSAELSDPNQTTVIVEERFSDFRPVDGLTLPAHWNVRYRTEPQSRALEYQWDVTFQNIVHNSL